MGKNRRKITKIALKIEKKSQIFGCLPRKRAKKKIEIRGNPPIG